MSNKSYNSKKEQLFESLELHKGNISNACKAIDISRVSFYRWLKEHEDLKAHLDDVQESAIDYVEDKLFGLIDDKNPTAIIFYLKTKGRKRGYIERQEIEIGNSDVPFSIEIAHREKDNKTQ